MSVTLSSTTITTDPFAGLSLTGSGYTNVTVSWENVSSSSADFRIVNEDGSFESENVTVSGSGSGIYTVTGLQASSTEKYFLQRWEIDSWIQQTSSTSGLDYVQSTTKDTSITIAVGSSSASVSWVDPGVTDVTYSLNVVNQDNVEFPASISGNSAIVQDLNQGDVYQLSLFVQEGSGEITQVSKSSGVDGVIEFTPSVSAAIVVESGPFASYVELDWSDSVDGTGASYRIVSRDTSSGSDDVVIDSATITNATIADLTPGNSYIFVLQRLELDGSFQDQSQTLITTPSTSISIGSVGSSTLQVSWDQIYDGANFELLFNGESSGVTQDTSVILRDLQPATSYDLQLTVVELNESVGLSKLGVTTNKSLVETLKLSVTLPILAVVIIVIIMMMKK